MNRSKQCNINKGNTAKKWDASVSPSLEQPYVVVSRDVRAVIYLDEIRDGSRNRVNLLRRERKQSQRKLYTPKEPKGQQRMQAPISTGGQRNARPSQPSNTVSSPYRSCVDVKQDTKRRGAWFLLRENHSFGYFLLFLSDRVRKGPQKGLACQSASVTGLHRW